MNEAKILIIEDEAEFAFLLQQRLEASGYEVITASDGEEGLSKVETAHPQLIICDINMPKKNGFEVLKELRQVKKNTSPFIMLTAVTDFNKIKNAYGLEADFYVTKPCDTTVLLKNIQILLSLPRSET